MARIKTPSNKAHQYKTPTPVLKSVPLDEPEVTEPPVEKDEEQEPAKPQLPEATETEANLQLQNLQSAEDQTPATDYSEEQKADVEAVKFANRPIADRIFKLNELYALTDKRDKLIQTREKLARFTVSAEEKADNLTLEDGEGKEFTTYNKSIIREVIQLIKNRTEEQIRSVEAQITI